MPVHDAAARGFQSKADAYERGRPEYPPEAVACLIRALRIGRGSRVVDLGAGTGKFTRALLPTGAALTGIEPVEAMRRKFTELLPGVGILDGTAESIPLPAGSADAVVAAQAFHWFGTPAVAAEIHRVLAPGGALGLIWNARDDSADFGARLTEIIDRYCGDIPRYRSGNWKKAFEGASLFSPLEMRSYSHVQTGRRDLFFDRIASISAIASLPADRHAECLGEVGHLIDTHPETRGRTEMTLPYRTDVYWCRASVRGARAG